MEKESKDLMLFDRDARSKLLEGARIMYKSVCSTLSPKGRNVAISRPWGNPIAVHDGVTVAREVKSNDRFVQIGINMIKEAATRTNEEAGDGTTSSTLIAYETVSRGMKLLDNGVNPMVLRDEVFTALEDVKKYLKKITKKIKGIEDLKRVATISSASKDIGELVGNVVHKVGEDGLVTVEEAAGEDTYVDHSEGMSLDKGFSSSYFITNPNRMEATINKPSIIITDKPLTMNVEIVPIIEAVIKNEGKNIVIIGDVSGEALATMIANKMKGIINCLAIKMPGYGDLGKGFLEDIAILTGGKVISKELGYSPEQFAQVFDESWIGHADKVIADKRSSVIVKGKGNNTAVKEQIQKLRAQISKAAHLPERENLQERIAKLSTGVSVIRVGAKTELEGREKVERVKDAVGAAQSALREGIVPGSGVTFLRLADAIKGDSDGAQLLRDVLACPLKKVMENSGEDDKTIKKYLQQIKDNHSLDFSYESISGKLCNMYEKGIIDPAKVIRLCMENGISVATMILTTDTIIDYLELPEVK